MTPEETKAEAQSIFDQVVAHLRTQNKKSERVLENGLLRCLYHHPDGLKCAVGCLIPEADYHPTIEKHDLLDAIETVSKPLRDKLLRHEGLLGDLQGLHDGIKIDAWEVGFIQIAQDHHLMFVGKSFAEAIANPNPTEYEPSLIIHSDKEPTDDIPPSTIG